MVFDIQILADRMCGLAYIPTFGKKPAGAMSIVRYTIGKYTFTYGDRYLRGTGASYLSRSMRNVVSSAFTTCCLFLVKGLYTGAIFGPRVAGGWLSK